MTPWFRFLAPLGLLLLAPLIAAGEHWTQNYEGVGYEVYVADPSELELHWKNGAGEQHRTFAVLQKSLRDAGREPVFLMNAGIFEPGGIPSGLHLENGKELLPLNLKPGKGNFFLKPNGVFLILDGKARVVESREYDRAKVKPSLALQSGPLLLRGGKIHPAFNADSPNQLRRNGVGVNQEGKIILVMTSGRDQRVNLHGFASFFLAMECKDALFLDGDISKMEVEPDPKTDLKPGNAFGAILAVTKEREK